MPTDGRHAETIEDVLQALDAIIVSALEERSRIGYFAAVYRTITARVRDGIAAGFFDDGDRMTRLDVAFADRYLAALDGFRCDGLVTRSWQVAFEAAGTTRPIILQHLLVGINAHINLDLGIAAAEVAPGAALADLRRDFDRINEIIGTLVADVASILAEVSPWLGLLDRVGGRHDDEVLRFSIEVARSEAWRFAVELAALAPDHWPGPIGSRDARVAGLATTVLHPGWLSVPLLAIRSREGHDVRRTITALQRVAAPDLSVVEARVRLPRAPVGRRGG